MAGTGNRASSAPRQHRRLPRSFDLPEAIWYRGHPLSHLLLPLSLLYCAGMRLRHLAYRHGWLPSCRLAVPVIVVGNLTVGGTGKTPLVLWLTDLLRRRGYRPGIITRGYGGSGTRWPRLVHADSDPIELGDEPVLLARRSGCPVVAGPDRVAAGELLLASCKCDMIVTDDGLQHYRLQRDLEILVVDASRGLGNGRCLPAGPLREPATRTRLADLKVCNGGPCPQDLSESCRTSVGHVMQLVPGHLINLAAPMISQDLATWRGRQVTAVAGIGNPERFFDLLRRHGLQLDERPYPDHHPFGRRDAAAWPAGPVIMTEKDAVKCADFARANFWYLPVQSRLEQDFERLLVDKLKGIGNG